MSGTDGRQPGDPGAKADNETYDLTESDQDTSGDMGVSSERVGNTGPGQHGSTGVRDVGPAVRHLGAQVRPEQARGGPEVNPDPPSPPVAGYPSHHPDSADTPYRKGRRRQDED